MGLLKAIVMLSGNTESCEHLEMRIPVHFKFQAVNSSTIPIIYVCSVGRLIEIIMIANSMY